MAVFAYVFINSHERSEVPGTPYRNAVLSGILYLVRSVADCQTCEQNSRALHAQTMLSGLPLYSRTRKIPMYRSFCMVYPELLLYWPFYDNKQRSQNITGKVC